MNETTLDESLDEPLVMSPDEQRLAWAAERAPIKRIEFFETGFVKAIEFHESESLVERESAFLLATSINQARHYLREAISKNIEAKLRKR